MWAGAGRHGGGLWREPTQSPPRVRLSSDADDEEDEDESDFKKDRVNIVSSQRRLDCHAEKGYFGGRGEDDQGDDDEDERKRLFNEAWGAVHPESRHPQATPRPGASRKPLDLARAQVSVSLRSPKKDPRAR